MYRLVCSEIKKYSFADIFKFFFMRHKYTAVDHRTCVKNEINKFQIKNEQKLFEASRASEKRSNSSSSISSRDRPPRIPVEAAYALQQRRRSNGIVNRNDPFHDVDKIYRFDEFCNRDLGIGNYNHNRLVQLQKTL